MHTARRTLATQLVEHGLPPYEQVMKITGHKKLSTLQKYIKSDSDIDLMLEVGKKIKDKYKMVFCATLFATLNKKPLEYQGVNCY